MFQDGSIGYISSASLPRFLLGRARTRRRVGLACCRHTAYAPVSSPTQGTGRDFECLGQAAGTERGGCNSRHPGQKPRTHSPSPARYPGHLADADQHAQTMPGRRTAQVISMRATLRPSGSLLAISSPFNSLFKVLFIFPSRYLFAIGLPPIFSFRWNLPPT